MNVTELEEKGVRLRDIESACTTVSWMVGFCIRERASECTYDRVES